MSIFGIGGPQFGLDDAKVARNNLNGTWQTMVDVPSVQLLGVNLQTTQAELEGDDTITATQSRARSAEVTLRFGSINLAVLAVMTGEVQASSGSTPNRFNKMIFDADPTFPYFGLCGRAFAAEATGADTHLFVPKAKITEGFEVRMEYGNFAIPELTVRAIRDTAYGNQLFQIAEHETALPVSIPPL